MRCLFVFVIWCCIGVTRGSESATTSWTLREFVEKELQKQQIQCNEALKQQASNHAWDLNQLKAELVGECILFCLCLFFVTPTKVSRIIITSTIIFRLTQKATGSF